MDDILKIIQGLAAAIVSIAIAASVSYETGYFSIIGYKYQSLLSAADYASGTLEWLPWLFLLYSLGFLLARAGSSALLKIIVGIKIGRPLVFWMGVSVLVLVMAAVVVSVPFYQVLRFMPVAVLPLVAIAASSQLARSGLPGERLMTIAASTVAVLFALFCSGIGQAHRNLEVVENAYVIWINNDHEGTQVLRTLGKGLLIWRSADNKVDFVRWEKVDHLTNPVWKSLDAPWMDSLACKTSRWFCYHKPPPEP
ncbi:MULTISPECIES: hypothetical protein [unclassified Bradyrhizobium]|uniref:hypothetical protein n=1 Tax=unclassified Bradyrhizobium TaxID=2631580 RepID=UPI002916629A|nr:MULTISPECIES: hypothetical protein [unclassified Bradyrhizobium]